jgi:hypothetical protein
MGQPLIDRGVEVFDAAGIQQVFAIAPFGASETRAERIARLANLGVLDPACPQCAEMLRHPTLNAFMPRHRASSHCRSGRRNHCTCDGCF